MRDFRYYNRQVLVFVGICVGLLLARIVNLQSLRYVFLIWNLILAYIPFYISFKINRTEFRKSVKVSLMGIWLLFFPNAPYLVTDLIHLHKSSSPILGFDVVLLFLFATLGVYLAVKSASEIQDWISLVFGKVVSVCIMVVFFLLSGFGIYLGRNERWNSWDVFTNPVNLLEEIINLLQNKHVLMFSSVYAVMIIFVYLVYKSETKSIENECLKDD